MKHASPPAGPLAAPVPETEAGYWDAVADEWADQGRQTLWRVHADAVNVALLSRWLPPAPVGRLLKTDAFDEAVGEGLVPFLGQRAAVTLMDVSGVVIAAASRRYPEVEAVCADARVLPFENGAFDVIVSNSTLDHFASLAEVAQALAEFHRVLRPGGTLVLTLDNLANPIVAVRNALPFALVARLHLVPVYVGASCGPRRERRLVEDAGFRVEEQSAILHCPRVLAVPAAGLIERSAGAAGKRRFLRVLAAWERLGSLPTRSLTGHFIAARAVRL